LIEMLESSFLLEVAARLGHVGQISSLTGDEHVNDINGRLRKAEQELSSSLVLLDLGQQFADFLVHFIDLDRVAQRLPTAKVGEHRHIGVLRHIHTDIVTLTLL